MTECGRHTYQSQCGNENPERVRSDSLATDRPGTWYPEARSPLLSRGGHRAVIFLGAPSARLHRRHRREGRKLPIMRLCVSFDRGGTRDRELLGEWPFIWATDCETMLETHHRAHPLRREKLSYFFQINCKCSFYFVSTLKLWYARNVKILMRVAIIYLSSWKYLRWYVTKMVLS